MEDNKIENEEINENEELEITETDEKKLFESKRYSVPFEMFEQAYTVFQKKYVYPRNIILSALLVVVGIANIVNIVMGNNGTLNYVLVFVCMALAAVNLYNPKKIKNNLMRSVEGIENDVYTLDIYSDKMVVGTVLEPLSEESEPEEYEEVFGETEPQEEILPTDVFVNNSLLVTERSEFFIVYIKKSMFYIVPKSIFTDDEISRFALYFTERIGNNFVCEADK